MSSSSSTSLPWYFNVANRLELIARKLGINAVNLNMESLIAEARKQTGLTQFSDYDFRTPLACLLNAYENEADLSLLGRFIVRTSALQSLTAQLKIQEEFRKHPEILDTPIKKPIFILGFPRTGTTLLHNLLGQGSQARALKLWQLEQPTPPIGPDTSEDDPRIKQTESGLEKTYKIVPHLRAVHSFDAHMPEECVVLLRKIFTCPTYSIEAHVPSYHAWIQQADFVPVYQEYKKMLQLLMWKFPGKHVVLKSPLHLYFIDALLEVFPDACIIQTHRDIKTLAGSGCSLHGILRSLYNVSADPMTVGRDWLDTWETGINRAVAARKELDADRIYDMDYKEFVSDPVKSIQKIYEQFEIEFDAETEASCKNYIANNPSGQHGKHSYSIADYGIQEEEIEQRFAEYITRY
jgi:hypothetical protein